MANITLRQKLIRDIRLTLGEGMIKVELTPDHYELAVDQALARYRQRSSNAVEERTVFLELTPGQSSYTLPEEIMEVRQIFRKGIGATSGSGAYMDPFAAAFTNQFMLGANGSSAGLVSYELFAEYKELLGRMFGLHIIFHWHPTVHRLDIQRMVTSPETVMLWVYNYRPEDLLFIDTYARPWLLDWATAKCKFMLGDARSKFAGLGGPQGGISLNGDALKNEASMEMDRLEKEVSTQVDQSMGYGFFFG